jgi:hypothetical protein
MASGAVETSMPVDGGGPALGFLEPADGIDRSQSVLHGPSGPATDPPAKAP